jgi:hypothetical protein
VGSKTLTTHGSEALAWSHAAWLLADFLAFAADEQGATAKLTDASSPGCWRRMPAMSAGADLIAGSASSEVHSRLP